MSRKYLDLHISRCGGGIITMNTDNCYHDWKVTMVKKDIKMLRCARCNRDRFEDNNKKVYLEDMYCPYCRALTRDFCLCSSGDD